MKGTIYQQCGKGRDVSVMQESLQLITANGHTCQSSDSSLTIGLYSSSYTLFTLSLTFTYFIIVLF